MKISLIKSLNHSKKKRNISKIDFIIIHYTGMQSKRASIERLTSKKHQVSTHYLIDRAGKTIKMIDEKKIAWHAGKSKWKNFKNLNNNSIGIELVNKGHRLGYQKFSKKQIDQLVKLCRLLQKKFKIPKSCILGHSDIAPLRKIDPGEKFPWFDLSKKGIGIWYPSIKKNLITFDEKKNRKNFFKNLTKIGYRYFSDKKFSSRNVKVIKAFQRRFLQNQIDGKIDQKAYIISQFLAKKFNN